MSTLIPINTSIICKSLIYLNNNYSSLINASKWISDKLSEIKYKDEKLLQSLNNQDIPIIENIIHFVKDKNIVEKYLFKYCTKYVKKRKSYYIRDATPWDKKYFLDIIKLVISKDIIDIHYKEDFLLRYASLFHQVEVVRFLIDNGADIHSNDDESLRVTSSIGDYDIAKLLIDSGANVHAKDNSALRIACRNSHYDIVKLLIDNGADAHIKKNNLI